jgi:uncharacterized membrane protein YtjA (UPF0391 family)
LASYPLRKARFHHYYRQLAIRHSSCVAIHAETWNVLPSATEGRTTIEIHFTEARCVMLSWALTFLVIALIAAALGFGGLAGTASYIAQVLFFVFLVLFIISLIVPRVRPPVS